MSNLAKILIGGGCALLLILIATFLLLRHLITKSFPVTDGVLTVEGLHAPVDIYRDEYGVPHVKAEDGHDLMFATGYVQAQDRLWQMDLMRRAGEGRLSEVLGEKTLEFDRLFRTIGLPAVAESIAQHLHPTSRTILEDYASGVNSFILTHKGKYPMEFDMLNYEPELWKIEHSVVVGRLLAWELNLAWWTDLAYGEIAAKVPPQKLREIFPEFPDSIPVTVPSSLLKSSLSEFHGVLDVARSYRKFFGLGSLEAGSNGWVVDSSKSISGKPLLANDPHLAMPAPSRWYEMHLSAPGWNVSGVSIPGIPLIIIGHNDRLAWGLTNAMLDDADFFIEKIDSTDSNKYIVRNKPIPFQEHEEKIFIKQKDSVRIIVRSTLHGPVINDVHPSFHHQENHEPVAMRWTGLDVADELYGFYQINRAGNYKEFENGLREITVPGQAVVYGDVYGNIAYWTTGHVPIRTNYNPMLPEPGWTGDASWTGFVPFDQLPKLINPRDGIIACANQKIADWAYPHYLSTLWEPPSRIQRIRQLLHSAEKFSPNDFQQFQQDVVSPYAREITAHLIGAYDSTSARQDGTEDALNYLRNWDFRFTQHDIATTIFNAFLVRLQKNIYEDEMGEDVFNDFVFFGAIPYRVTSQLLAADSSLWFDNVTTSQVETKKDILRLSLRNALDDLRSQIGPEMKTWQWGTMHTVTFQHPFGTVRPLDKVFNIGPFPVSGGGTTVNKSEYKIAHPFTTSVGASMRQVIDLATPDEAFVVITSGEVGQPLNKHYDDQTALWLNGGYHRTITDWNRITQTHWDHLVLKP